MKTRSPEDRTLETARRIVHEVFGPCGERPFAVRYWNGAVDSGSAGPWRCTLHLRRSGALRRMFWPPSELSLANAFVDGDFDIDGDLEIAIGAARMIPDRIWRPGPVRRLALLLARMPSSSRRDSAGNESLLATPNGPRHSPVRDAASVRFHYDVGNAFYRLWLDEDMVYSCGLFVHGDESIEEAQAAKLDLICRKLRLTAGDRLLDVGCGWGALVRHATRHYGVTAVGITVSAEQALWARQAIRREGLDDRCDVFLADYRDVARFGTFDKIASVGMCEHVGSSNLNRYFDQLYARLRSGGVLLNHGIVSLDAARHRGVLDRARSLCWREGGFIDRYIFPDGELLPLARMTAAAERAGFETRDVEGLRTHYTRTLRHWRCRLEANEAAAVALVGAGMYRAWRLYLAASAQAFESAHIGIVQQLLARPDANGRSDVPATRDDLYRTSSPVVNGLTTVRWSTRRIRFPH